MCEVVDDGCVCDGCMSLVVVDCAAFMLRVVADEYGVGNGEYASVVIEAAAGVCCLIVVEGGIDDV